MDIVGDKIINLMLLVMISPNDKAPAGNTFGNCLSRPRTRSFYDTSSELIALTKRGGLWDPPLNYRRYSYIQRVTKIGFPFGAYA